MSLLIIAFIAGILTALAPCVLPLIPVIVGGSLAGSDRKRPYIIVGALGVSLFVFTLALKATTALLGVPPVVWTLISGGLVLVIGITTVWPHLYERLSGKTGFYQRSQKFLGGSSQRAGWLGPVLMGAALGPVFASCSPTYALIIATVLPAGFALGVLYLAVYTLGLTGFLLLVALLGRRLTKRLGWALNPDGWFKRGLGILFIVVGIAVLTGTDKRVENYLIDHQLFNATQLEQHLLPGASSGRSGADTATAGTAAEFNIKNPMAAPELSGISNWINTDGETIKSLKGKVVLIDFWTYSCINCIHTLPHVEGWYKKYQAQGLVVLGIHAPEFSFEHVPANVTKAVKDRGITYPVGLDNDFATWHAYDNQYWPAEYFIDRDGKLRHYHFGEGEYDQSEAVIRALLAENGTKLGAPVEGAAQGTAAAGGANHSPETYLGYERASGNANAGGLVRDQAQVYTWPTDFGASEWALSGTWTVGAQAAVAGEGAKLRYRFSGRQAYLVMGAPAPVQVGVSVGGRPVAAAGLAGADVAGDSTARVDGSRLYRLVKSAQPQNGALLELTIPPGTALNAFTFDD